MAYELLKILLIILGLMGSFLTIALLELAVLVSWGKIKNRKDKKKDEIQDNNIKTIAPNDEKNDRN